jgi:molybdopterin converting factor small subunit
MFLCSPRNIGAKSMTLSTEILTRSPLLDADEIEGEIGNIIHNTRRGPFIRAVPHSDDHPLPVGPMPDYVEHKEGVNQVGKLSAEAVVREYEAAVKEIEALGAELSEAAKKCEAMVAGVHAMVDEIKELAANYREEGKRYFLQIEDCSLMTSEVRTVCETLKKKIAAGSSLAA